MRVLFGEKRKFEKLYSYTFDYLNGLNGFNINFQNKKTAFYGKKTLDFLEDLSKKKFIEEELKNEEIFVEGNEDFREILIENYKHERLHKFMLSDGEYITR